MGVAMDPKGLFLMWVEHRKRVKEMGTFDGSDLLDGNYTQRFELAELYRRFKQGAGKADLRQPAPRAELKVEGSGKPQSGSEGSSR
jgi:hypothetical protein